MAKIKGKRRTGRVRLLLSGRHDRIRNKRLQREKPIAFNVHDNDSEHSLSDHCDRGEEDRTAAANALLMLQTSEGTTPERVWANRNCSPFIVTPKKRRVNCMTSSEQLEDVIHVTPTSSHTFASPLVLNDHSPRRVKRKPRFLAKEFESSDYSGGGKSDPIAEREKIATSSAGSERLEPTLTRTDSVMNLEEFATSSGSALVEHTLTPTDSRINLEELSTTGSTTKLVEHKGIQTDDPPVSAPTASCFSHWRYSRMLSLPREEFRRITGVNQENFEVLYKFLGGDEVCDYLKYDYEAPTPKRKRPSSLSVKQNIRKVPSEKNVRHSWKDTSRLSSKDKLFLTLIRLRRGFALEDLALLFGMSKSQVSTIFFVWVQFLYLQFKRIQGAMCVTRHDQPPGRIAPCFRAYKNFRIVLDTTEIRIQTPKNYQQQGNTYSQYKAGNVILYMIGLSGFGSISFVSPGFEGSMSDREIFIQSGLVQHLERNDLILVDRGFKIKDITDQLGVTVVHPPFVKNQKPLCPEDLMLTKRIGSDRSHVERVIRKIKCFSLLKRVTNKMLPILDQLVYVCSCLVNFDADILLQ